jgi:hypothetical protein
MYLKKKSLIIWKPLLLALFIQEHSVVKTTKGIKMLTASGLDLLDDGKQAEFLVDVDTKKGSALVGFDVYAEILQKERAALTTSLE